MKSIGLAAGVMTLLFAGAALADSAALGGSWKGPWYIGMSSGIAEMDIAADHPLGAAVTAPEGGIALDEGLHEIIRRDRSSFSRMVR